MVTQDRVAVIGIGSAAEVHAHALADIDHATLVAGSCRTESKGRTFADRFSCTWYADSETMLDAESPDLVIVATPSGNHLPMVELAADHGADVLCEKPLEITTARIDEMVRLADDAGISLGGIFQQRFNPVIRTVHDAAADGRFGRLAIASASVPWWRSDDYYASDHWRGTQTLDGGELLNQAIHSIDALQWLAGATMDLPHETNPVAAVTAYTARRSHDSKTFEVEDTAVAALRFENGALGYLLGATSMYPGSSRRIQLAGRNGTARIQGDELDEWAFREETPNDATLRERFDNSHGSGGAAEPMDISYDNHTRNIEAFLNARGSSEPYLLDATAARKAVAIVEAIYESANRGEFVDLNRR